jgi:hypothetical protein
MCVRCFGLFFHSIRRPLEAVLTLPGLSSGFGALRAIPGLGITLARPISVDCVGAVAATAATGALEQQTPSATASSGKQGNILEIDDIVREFR